MRTLFLLFDSLNRRALECYGGTAITHNFSRLAERAVVFDNHYVGSLPCMPARRDIHTGRLNFLHRSWGPLEPYDHSFPDLLKNSGIYSHLITDHYHYFEDGGATYHNRYNSWELYRGQEWDPWAALVDPPDEKFQRLYHPLQYDPPRTQSGRAQAMINREFIHGEDDYSMVQCFESAWKFLDNNRDADNWVLQIECFDPHEPFFAPEKYRVHYHSDYQGQVLNWPRYNRVEETPEEIREIQANYSALVTMCDTYLGKLLDYFDSHGLWENTALIVSTDHGFMLAEHEWWAKSRMPFYNEVAHIPLIFHHPEFRQYGGERRNALTQTIDIMPTLLELNGVNIPDQVLGHSLISVLEEDKIDRTAVIYGRFGASVNITDGRYTYFLYPDDLDGQELYEYTLMPTHQKSFFRREEFTDASLENEFAFARGFPVLKLPARRGSGQGAKLEDTNTVLYDLQTDPGQLQPISMPEREDLLKATIVAELNRHEAPPEAFRRFGLAD